MGRLSGRQEHTSRLGRSTGRQEYRKVDRQIGTGIQVDLQVL